MIPNPLTKACENLAALLTKLVEAEKTTLEQLACVAQIDARTVRRYLNAEYEIPDNVLMAWQDARPVDASVKNVCREALAFRAERLTGCAADGELDERKLDANRDGRVDHRDVYEFHDQENTLAVESGRTFRNAMEDGQLSSEEYGAVASIEARRRVAASRKCAVIQHLAGAGVSARVWFLVIACSVAMW